MLTSVPMLSGHDCRLHQSYAVRVRKLSGIKSVGLACLEWRSRLASRVTAAGEPSGAPRPACSLQIVFLPVHRSGSGDRRRGHSASRHAHADL